MPLRLIRGLRVWLSTPGSPDSRIPLVIMIAGVVTAIILNVGYTTWAVRVAIAAHSSESCPELGRLEHIRAVTPFERVFIANFRDLYQLRCR